MTHFELKKIRACALKPGDVLDTREVTTVERKKAEKKVEVGFADGSTGQLPLNRRLVVGRLTDKPVQPPTVSRKPLFTWNEPVPPVEVPVPVTVPSRSFYQQAADVFQFLRHEAKRLGRAIIVSFSS